MGTVGLSFGSATSGAGFDVSSTVSQILAVQKGVETPWNNQLTHLHAQDTVLSTLGSDLATLSSSLQSLTSFDGVMYGKDGSSSNSDVLALSSATSSATAGNHEVTVTQLARTSSVYTPAVAPADTLSGSLTLQVGTGAVQTITLDSDSNTLGGLARAINLANLGVTANIVSDTSGSRLSIVSATSGTAGQLTISSSLHNDTTSSPLATQVGQTGQDAHFSIDGVALTSSSNIVSTAIPGVTFQLLSTSSSSVQVAIANNTSAISSTVSTLAAAYNKLVADMSAQEGKDSNGVAQPLYGSPTLSLLQSSLAAALTGGAAKGSISSMAQLGLSVNQDGTLTFSNSDLQSSLNQHFTDVVAYLQDTDSFGQGFTNALNGLSSTRTTGALYLAQQENSTQEATLNKNISDLEDRLASQKTRLTEELTSANQILQSIPSQLEQVEKMYSAVTGYKSN